MAQPAVTGPEFGWQYTLPVREGVLKDQAKERHLRPVPDLPPDDEYEVTTLDSYINDGTGNATFDLEINTKPGPVEEASETPIYDKLAREWTDLQHRLGKSALYTANEGGEMSLDTLAPAEMARHGAEPHLVSVDEVRNRTDENGERVFRATPELCDEVERLQNAGYDVAFTDPYDREGLPAEQAAEATKYIAELEAVADSGEGAERFLQDPAVQVWNNLKMRAISLYPLYGASRLQTLGEGIDQGIYEQPLFEQPDGTFISANDALRKDMASTPEKAELIIAHYQQFIDQPISDHSRKIWGGSLDGRGVRTRAYEAVGEVVRHFSNEEGRIDRKDLKIASFACGAAGPISELVGLIQDFGGDVTEANLVDMDPMAIATAVSVMKPIADALKVHKQDLTRKDVTEYIAPESIDVADLLGLFEYFPDRLAVGLLKRVKEVMKPGGVIVFGNMVDSREELKFFNKVVKWPKLYGRSIEHTYGLIEQAGFDVGGVSARNPGREGVYTVYTIRIPEKGEAGSASDSDQNKRALGALATVS